MRELHFEGHSDDTFGEFKAFNIDHDNCASGEPIFFEVIAEGGEKGLIVRGQYADGPCAGWSIGVSPADMGIQEEHIPAWPIRLERSEREYSPRLVIEAPDDVVVRRRESE